jgi:long-chain acyl-CoA synthetase
MTTLPGMTRRQALAALTAPGMPYELATRDIDGLCQRVYVNAPPSLRHLFHAAASDATFLVHGDERLSFADTWERACGLAHAMVGRYGVRPGDRVAISMRNYPEWVIAFMAITSIGAIAVAMNAWWQAEEMAYALDDSGALLLLADTERLDHFAKLRQDSSVRAIAVRCAPPAADITDFAELMAGPGIATMPGPAPAADAIATLFYTSGSTGHPKGVPSSHRNILSALLSWELDAHAAARMAGLPAPVPPANAGTLLAVPLFHVTGSHAAYLTCYRAQRKLVSMYKWDVEAAAGLIERERLTYFVAPAAMTGDLVRHAASGRHDLSSLLLVGGGGAPRAPGQVHDIGRAFGQALPNTGWGMTETNAIGAGIGGQDYLEHPASSGRAAAVLDLRVVDEAGCECPHGERGELQVRGTSMFRGYWNRPELNASLFDDGWFRTGDVATIDAEGYVTIVDRIKDLIIRGGENVGCGQVEATLLLHPDVHEAAVYAVPDERLGEEVGATIHGRPGLDVEALRAFLKGHLAHFEMPRHIRISASPLPRTASGKLLKRQMRDEAVAALRG